MNGYLSESEMVVQEIMCKHMLPYKTVNLEGKWVSDNKKDIFENWHDFFARVVIANYRLQLIYPKSILIKAPTGTGKTTFVTKALANFAASKNKNVIIIVNRVVLANQILNDECKITLGYSLSPSSLGKINRANNLIIFTYQELASDWQNILWRIQSIPNVGYVVFDEAHFFIADALFNNQTRTIFRNVLECFRHKQRIYMSATPEDVRDIIAYEEKKLQDVTIKQTIDNYIMSDPQLKNEMDSAINNSFIQYNSAYQKAYSKYLSQINEMYRSFPL